MIGALAAAIRGAPDPNIEFEDNFGGGNIDLSKWTLTDTESKFAVSGGQLVCAGGKDTPAWGDPMLVGPGFTHVQTGLILEYELTPTNTGVHGLIGFSGSDGSSSQIVFYFNPTAKLSVNINDGSVIDLPFTFSADTSYRLRIVSKGSGGAIWYLSTDGGVSWKVVWESGTAVLATLYLFYRNHSLAFKSSYAKLSQSYLPTPIVNTSQAITPSLGGEGTVNGDMELDSDWSSNGTPTTQERSSEQKHGGSYSRKITVDAAWEGIYQGYTPTVGVWYLASMWVYGDGTVDLDLTIDNLISPGSIRLANAPASWSQVQSVQRGSTAGATTLYVRNYSADAGTFYVDDVSVKPLTLSSLVGTLQTARIEGIFEADITVASGRQAGFWFNTDGETDGTQNGVEVIIDRAANTVRVSKYVNGTLTNNVGTGAFTYGATQTLRAVRVGNLVQPYYNNAAIGTALTISDASILALNGMCAFSTDPDAVIQMRCYGGINVA